MDHLHAVFNHLVLPPKLPGEQDKNLEAISRDILKRFIQASETAQSLAPQPVAQQFQSLQTSLRSCLSLNRGHLEKTALRQHFIQLQPNRMLILHINEQNAALLIRREEHEGQDRVIFEHFEASPTSSEVLSARQALQWDFPGRSAQLPYAEFDDGTFQESLAVFLEKASMEPLYTLQAHIRKAGESVVEMRDTADPDLITQMLIPLLEAKGGSFQPPLLRKRVRDDVNIHEADLPWRRLPFWLVLRVAVQRQLCLAFGSGTGRMSYKILMCIFFSTLLKDSVGSLSPELTILLRTKLCRRMSKLEVERLGTGPASIELDGLFNELRPLVKNTIVQVTAQVEAAWRSFKHATTRRVPKLLRYAPDNALHLSLHNSAGYLDNLLLSQPKRGISSASLDLPQPLDKAIRQTQEFTSRIFRLAEMEAHVAEETRTAVQYDFEVRCRSLAGRIKEVFAEVGTCYYSDPEQMSTTILTIFNLWMRLDQCAVALCPLLNEYRTPFPPELLDVLQLPTKSKMCSLQEVQLYLARRESESLHENIFTARGYNSLATSYVAQSTEMQSLAERIQAASQRSRDVKEVEWNKACRKYDDLTEKISNGTCCCSWKDGKRDVKGCAKCFHWRTRKRMQIKVHEEFLPDEDPARAVVIFETALPSYLSIYRNTTWRILRTLAYPDTPRELSNPELKLEDHGPLQSFMSALGDGISVASSIKSFGQTHYKFHSGKVSLSRVLLPFAARFELYDNVTGFWVKDLNRPLTMQHLCGIHVPHVLQGEIVPRTQHPPSVIDGPSSYEIQANQLKCPSDVSCHEFLAFQKLLAGKVRCWPNILVEMGSSNLNFSHEDTKLLVCQLAMQAGPQLSEEPLRASHVVFKEPVFVGRLTESIASRLRSIKENWREHHCMELLITLSLRLFYLTSGEPRSNAKALLQTARDITKDWAARLRTEVRTANDAEAGERVAIYGVYAALLCRQTFAVYTEAHQIMTAEDLSCWVQASVAWQEHLVVEIDTLPESLRRILVRDAKLTYHITPLLKVAIKNHPNSVGDAIARGWSDSSNVDVKFTAWTFLQSPHDRWIAANTFHTQGPFKYRTTVHFNITEGHLLVNGRPRGKLPLEIRNDPAIKDLFGNQHLLTYPSSWPGMTHRLVHFVEGQEVHFGIRDQQVVIRARRRDGILEFVPKSIFSTSDSFDLPSELVDSCVHWLHLDSKCLEIRRMPKVWIKRPRDWAVDISSRRAYRGTVTLVDPRSDVFLEVARIFDHFVRPNKLTVFQPSNYKLSVDLRHLDLSFSVNGAGLLHCRQLGADIDPDQDAGTWYGLQSKIVLRDAVSLRRSIIIPLGQIRYVRQGMHVAARVEDGQEYGTFVIDDILRRLSCPPEPRLLFTKALCHAITSFCLPDVLTGRTGTEEAFTILGSSVAQPWIPLGPAAQVILQTLQALSPRREYYPPEIKRLQQVVWSNHLTMTIQHDGYEPLIRDITLRSNQLKKFSTIASEDSQIKEPTHLNRRGAMCRRVYERQTQHPEDRVLNDLKYMPRDHKARSTARSVYSVVRLVLTKCSSLNMTTTLKSTLASYQVLGGFHAQDHSSPYDSPLIDLIEGPINETWGDLVNFCIHAKSLTPVIFRLGLLAFAQKPNKDIIHSLAAFATLDKLKSLPMPSYNSFVDFKTRGKPSIQLLRGLIVSARLVFGQTIRRSNRGSRDTTSWDEQAYMDLYEEECTQLAHHLLNQWPASADMLSPGELHLRTIDTHLAVETIKPEWARRWENDRLEDYVDEVQAVLDLIPVQRNVPVLSEWGVREPSFFGSQHYNIIPSLAHDLVTQSVPPVASTAINYSFRKDVPKSGNSVRQSFQVPLSNEVDELQNMLERFASSPVELRRRYGNDLLQSLAALRRMRPLLSLDRGVSVPALETVAAAKEQARHLVLRQSSHISDALADDVRTSWLQLGAIFPCTTPTALLELLRSKSSYKFGHGMREALTSYGLNITKLQRLERIRQAILRSDTHAIEEELRNEGHKNWSALDRPDWLLLEIDSNLLIRAEQIKVAEAIIAPSSGQNSVLQMNMGKGKTSCIVPMVMAVLANGANLSRLIVPKALLMQTAQMVQSRLGGLVGREVCHIPFSRKSKTDASMLNLYAKLHHETYAARGLILTSHEHILSYKLGGWQHLLDGKVEAASTMINFQSWLDTRCRDVLDECDFTMSVKTQLNYPSGSEMAIDGHPFRWKVAQELLGLAFDHIPGLQKRFSSSVDVLTRPGSFPMVHFLKGDVEDALQDLVIADICAGRMTLFQIAESKQNAQQEAIRQILQGKKFDQSLFAETVSLCPDPQAASKILLVARGLLVNRLLLLCMGKRWNVQYGLHPGRHPVAVPFEAKGVPSEQSEFGQPDVAILFTCLAFYYSGLSLSQFRQGLQHVLQSDDPATQYERWTSGCNSLPETLHHWNVINVDDGSQVDELWRRLRMDQTVLNHYMNHFVFPVHAKQFEVKLQASAWDIPLYGEGQDSPRTTGFSGTNDNRMLLPLTIRQDDLPSLMQTSAEVLSYFLQKRNRGYHITIDSRGKRLTEDGLVRELHERDIRVLIDAGAHILEMDNRTLAKTWLTVDHHAKAAIYFGVDNRAWVHFKSETKDDVPLLATPFANDLSECVVYIDEAHTRGVDLKLPVDAHGALTLSLKQTKDATMQAAMRLRQLGTTQSVTFFSPPEVHLSITDFCRQPNGTNLDSSHVIYWLLEQSCRANEDLQSLYIAQGIDYCRRTDAVWKHRGSLANATRREQLLRAMPQPERQTLEQMYGAESISGLSEEYWDHVSAPKLLGIMCELLQSRVKDHFTRMDALQEVEQEREVQVQVEQVRQVQRPVQYEALSFPGLHPTIARFVGTGKLESTGNTNPGFEHAFACMARTGLGSRFGLRETGSEFYVSSEFGRTIKCKKRQQTAPDDFIRPVEWILWSRLTQTALVVIPEEVELLIPTLRLAAADSMVHLIAYAAPVTKRMACFNTLRYYTLPALPPDYEFPKWFRLELGILAGRLYVGLSEWDMLARYLQHPFKGITSTQEEREGRGDGELLPFDETSTAQFTESPKAFLLEWLVLRRKTQDILHTPMGYICSGRPSGGNHPFRDSPS